jgi:agarase
VAIAASWITASALGQAGFPLTGRFDGWSTLTIGDSELGSTLRIEPTSNRDWVVHGHPGEARRMSVTAILTPIRARGDQWKLAGVGCYATDDRFWHLALVESPNSNGAKRFIELSEMLDGEWNAQTILPDHIENGSREWQYGHAYRLKLTLGPEGILGEVRDGDTVLFRERRDFSPVAKAVISGRSGLTTSELTAEYSGVEAVESEWATKTSTSAHFPPYLGSNGHFFRTQFIGGKWWLTDPADKPFLVVTVDHVNYDAHFCEALGYAPFHRNLERRYGDEKTWAKDAVIRLKSWGFNALGAGCSPSLRRRGLPYTEYLSFGTAFADTAALVPKTNWTGWPDVFDPRWQKFCRIVASKTCTNEKDDPWLIGYTLDNELEWFGKSGQPWGIAEEAWKLPKERNAKIALVSALRTNYLGDVSHFNQDFGSSIDSFDALLNSTTPISPKCDGGREALMSFVRLAEEKYFTDTTQAIRAEDPNHLILGCRFAYDAPVPAVEAAGKTCDVVTVNIYPRVSLATGAVFGLKEHLDEFAQHTGRPLFVTEWGFPGLDAVDTKGLPLPSTEGAGMRVDTQAQRAACFRSMQTALFSHPSLIGSSFFMYADEPALGVSKSFPENSNYGLVSEMDGPYLPLVQAALEVNPTVSAIHENPPLVVTKTKDWLKPYPSEVTGISIGIVGNRYTVETQQLKLTKDAESGNAFDHVSLHTDQGWVDLGTYGPVIWLRDQGQNVWESPIRVEQVERTGPCELRVTLIGTQARTNVELRFFADAPYFLSRIVSVQSIASRPVSLRGVYHYPLWRSDEQATVQPYRPGVPDYWLPFGAWVSPRRDFALGALAQRDDSAFTVTFWRDAALHADFLRDLDVDLAPNHAWHANASESWAAVFLTRIDKSGRPDLSGVLVMP